MLRTFSKIYGLAGLRVGYAVGPRDVCAAMAKTRRPFDVTTPAQVAALASLGDAAPSSRGGARSTPRAASGSRRSLREHGLEPAAGRRRQLPLRRRRRGRRSRSTSGCSAQGVIVRPLHGFGAPTAIRVSVGTPDEIDFFAAALGRVRAAA